MFIFVFSYSFLFENKIKEETNFIENESDSICLDFNQ